MRGASVCASKPRPRSGRKTLRRCKNNMEASNVVLIDDEGSDSFDDVIVIDVPECSSKRVRGSSSRIDRRKTVICIDDDECIENNHPDDGVNGNESNGSSSSPAANVNGKFSDADGDDCQFISPVKILKCKRTYSGKAPATKRFGLGSDSEIDFSDDDFELEDSLGKIREQWEKASLKRKRENHYVRSDNGVCTNRSRVSPIIPQNVGKENMPEQDTNVPVSSSSGAPHENKDAQDGEIVDGFENCIINEKDKHKETDEYKKSVEIELAARQKVLQLQAEEAQKLRLLLKKKKAEEEMKKKAEEDMKAEEEKKLRLLLKRKKAEEEMVLGIERRQKERLEEVRESKKKDEEHMNLKEKIRAEIGKGLSKLELTCHDMASLLRSLGIPVGNEVKPSLNEVRSACKRALFTFHPDRASKSNIRQQVESEEKFKLISKMKDKFKLT